MAAEGKDIAWAQWAYCGGALVAGIALGTLVVAPMWEKARAKKAAKKGTTANKGVAKK
ncbi:hypothetical protein QQ008_07640 [Fulvivirgaceae bacterium BMA10]|uniref:Uncharacterized protein n=1 Tax=Splendidivirga corallicola TaxID=3051826 RepID=A0ABT8KNE0_9BACT|nr:hypothetical protein [Fulvivirgaceae bacterium BMA10]